MLETIAVGAPIEYANEPVKDLQSRRDPNRALTRYVFCIGDHIEAQDKRGLASIGGWAGGVWVGASETEGAPTMYKTHHVILRGGITPLESRAVSKKADHKANDPNDEEYMAGTSTRAYTVYAGEDLIHLRQATKFANFGIVEITALNGKSWESGEAKELQMHFFPRWNEWARREGKFPVLLSDWTDLVNEGLLRADTDAKFTTGEEMLESARVFAIGAANHISTNRARIESTRSVNMGGFTFHWNGRSRLYAQQLGETLEDERKIISQVSTPDAADMDLRKREADLKERDIQLREQELEFKRQQAESAMVVSQPAPKAELPSLEPEDGLKITLGQKVMVKLNNDLVEGEVVSKAFGRIKVKFADDSIATVSKDDIEV